MLLSSTVMSLLPDFPDRPSNLFTPDFGQRPHVMVGRDAMLESLREGLGAGPSDPRFTSLLLGPRGSGKTAILHDLGHATREAGWIVLPLDAATAGVQDRISELIAWAKETHETIEDDDPKVERTSMKVRLWPFEWQREAVSEIRPRWSVMRQLGELAERAGQHGTAVLLLLDELHSGELDELRRLSADLQHLVKGEHLPLAFIGAGLSEMKHTLLEDKRMTFFARCSREDMPPLSRIDATRFLSGTVRDAGGAFASQALETLADACGTLPYKMQLVGHYAWLAADAPLSPIDDAAADAAVREAERIMHERVALPAWHGLNDSEQSYLRCLNDLGGVATLQGLAANLDLPGSTRARTHLHLSNKGCIEMIDDDTVALADVVPAGSLQQIQRLETALQASPSRAGRKRCNEWMPRAQAPCVLTDGHKGAHRSQ